MKFYDVSNPAAPVFLSYWEAPASPPDPVSGQYPDMHGVHHFNFDGDYLLLGGEYEGYVGKIFVMLDLSDSKNPTEVSKWALPGQKTPEEDHIRDWTQVPKFNSPVIKLEDGSWRKHVGMHYVSVKGDTAYLSYHQKGLVILDIAERSVPKLLSHVDYLLPDAQVSSPDRAQCIASGGGMPTACGNAHSAKVLPHNENVLVMTDEYFSCPFGHMRLFDVSDPTAPTIISQFLLDENTQCSDAAPDKTGQYRPVPPSRAVNLYVQCV